MAATQLDPVSLGRIFDRHAERAFGYCVRLLGCEHDAADAVQDAFLNLARRRPTVPADPDAQRAYVFAAVRNAAFDLRRRRRDSVPADVLAERAAPEPSPEARLLAGEARAELRAALAAIPERQRAAWVLRELGECSYEEIGDRLGMNPNAVAQLLHRARRSLAAALG